MKARIYLRVARNGYKAKVAASTSSSNEPLSKGGGYYAKEFLPTVAFAVDFEIPDNLFDRAVQVIGKMVVTERDAVVAAEIPTAKQLKNTKEK